MIASDASGPRSGCGANSAFGTLPVASMRNVTSSIGSSSAAKPYMRRCSSAKPSGKAARLPASSAPSGTATGNS